MPVYNKMDHIDHAESIEIITQDEFCRAAQLANIAKDLPGTAKAYDTNQDNYKFRSTVVFWEFIFGGYHYVMFDTYEADLSHDDAVQTFAYRYPIYNDIIWCHGLAYRVLYATSQAIFTQGKTNQTFTQIRLRCMGSYLYHEDKWYNKIDRAKTAAILRQ